MHTALSSYIVVVDKFVIFVVLKSERHGEFIKLCWVISCNRQWSGKSSLVAIESSMYSLSVEHKAISVCNLEA